MATPERKIMNRLYLTAFFLFLFMMAIIFKLVRIQLVEGEKYRLLAEERTVRNFIIRPSRGNIYAADGSLLATSVPEYEIRFDTQTVSQRAFEDNLGPLSDSLSLMLGKSPSYYQNQLSAARRSGSRYHLIARHLNYEQYTRIKNFPLFRLGSFKGGFIAESNIIRAHPLGKIAERTVGYEREDDSGYYFRAGVEGAFSKYLAGREGHRLKQRIGQGQWKPINDTNEQEPLDGYDVITTLDLNIQDVAHHALLEQLEKYKADHGCVVVMETKTGEVKAISNLGRSPSGFYYERRNYAIWESHEPGSTFKLMAMIAMLEDKVIDTAKVVDTENGVLTFFNKYKVRDSHRGGYGKITAGDAFLVSSNTALVKMVYDNYKDRPERFVERLYNMNLNEPLHLAIKGEGVPKIPHPKDPDWDGLDLPWMAFGYGVSLTPLQILTFYNAVANDGEMVRPRFIKAIKELDQPIEHFGKEVINPSICSKSTLSKVKELMRKVVEDKRGTAHSIYSADYALAGKTGTCQVDYSKGEADYISSFVGYFPADHPTYSCIVVIHKPDKTIGYYGAHVAAPVFKTIAHKIYTDIPITDEVKDINVVEPRLVKAEQSLEREKRQLAEQMRMPDVKGMSIMDAVPLLENLGLRVQLEGIGIINEQSINPGDPIEKDMPILLKV